MTEIPERVRGRPWAVLLALMCVVLACLFVYGKGVVENDFTFGDDNRLIVENPLIRELSWGNLKGMFTKMDVEFYPIPFTYISFALDYRIGALDPRPYHVTNLVLHMANSLLAFAFIWMLTRNVVAPFIASMLFAIHPLHVESVAWVSERKDVLMGFFFILSLMLYLLYIRRGATRWYLLSFLCFLLALFSKPLAVTIPLLLFLLDWFERRPRRWRTFLEKIPHFAVAVVVGLITLRFQRIGGMREADLFHPLENFLTMCRAFTFYLQKTVWPANLSFIHPFSKPITFASTEYLFAMLASFAILFVVIISLRWTRLILFGFLFFLLAIAPVLQWIPVGNYPAAERYAYIPAIGLFYLTGVGFDRMLWRLKRAKTLPPRYYRGTAWALLALALLLYAFMAKHAVSYWRDSTELWKQAAKVHPEDPKVWVSLASAVHRVAKGTYASQEIDYLKKAVEVDPANYYALLNLGATLIDNGLYEEAIPYLERALETGEKGTAADSLGRAYFYLGRMDEAIPLLKQALDVTFPTYTMPEDMARERRSNILLYLGLAYRKIHKFEESLQAFREGLECSLTPEREEIAIAETLKEMGHREEALNAFREVVRKYPSSEWVPQVLKTIKKLETTASPGTVSEDQSPNPSQLDRPSE